MFGKKDEAPIKTLIAQGTRIEGGMKFDEGLRVDGEVYGAIHANAEGGSLLVISEGAVAEGGLKADHVIINGTVKGPVEARSPRRGSRATCSTWHWRCTRGPPSWANCDPWSARPPLRGMTSPQSGWLRRAPDRFRTAEPSRLSLASVYALATSSGP
jgi:hypothetical protein